MKIINLLQARKAIGNYANEPVAPRLAYKMMKFLKTTETEESFLNEKLKNIAEEYSAKDADGKMIATENGEVKISVDKINECNAKIMELYDTEVETPTIRFFLDELDALKISASDMRDLDDFIDEAN